VVQEHALLELVPAVVLRGERLDADGEERLLLSEPATLELEGCDACGDHGPEHLGGEDEAGLFPDLAHGCVLEGLPFSETAAGRDPPGSAVRPTGIGALLKQHAAVGDHDHACRLPFDDHVETVSRSFLDTGGNGRLHGARGSWELGMDDPQPDVVELRLALVCYGGVSLAIYMHGITKEVQKLVVASIAFERDEFKNPFRHDDSSHAYWELLKRVRHGHVGEVGRREVRLSVVVDIVSGTSAGGINGICLAKVLAGNHSQDALRDLWLDRGDIKQLIRGSRRLPVFLRALALVLGNPLTIKPPLRGDDMCVWLHKAFEDMTKTRALRGVESLIPPDHEVQLFVPITDFHGYWRDIPLYDPRIVRDRTHRHVMEFRHEEPDGGNLGREFHHILAFTARATSSFPGAFPPISFNDYEGALKGRADLTRFKKRFFPLYTMAETDPRDTQFIDGGVLDNFPFGRAIDAIQAKPAKTEVDRRLMYIEPDPGEDGRTKCREPPGLWRTVFAGYASIPRREPILDDLFRIVGRNEDVLRIRDVIEANFTSINDQVTEILERELRTVPKSPTQEDLVSMWARVEDRALDDAGFGQGTYLRLRVRSAVEGLAFAVAKALWFPPESNECRFVTAVLRRWAAGVGLFGQGPDPVREQAQRAFLASLDIAYRERRVRFVIAAMNWWYRDIGNLPVPPRKELDEAKERLYERVASLRVINATVAEDTLLVDTAREAFSPEEMSSARGDDDTALDEFLARQGGRLDAVRGRAASIVSRALPPIELQLHRDLLDIMSEWDDDLRGDLLTRYLGFPFWDILVFPLQDTSGVGERDHVEVYRMSPHDVNLLAPREKKKREKWKKEKLKGMSLFHFGAFFDRQGRECDYLWGRLDAVERLVKLLLDARPEPKSIATPPGPEPRGLSQDELAAECKPAFEAILADERGFLPQAGNLIEKIGKIVARLPSPT
jgi:patatin-related protein